MSVDRLFSLLSCSPIPVVSVVAVLIQLSDTHARLYMFPVLSPVACWLMAAPLRYGITESSSEGKDAGNMIFMVEWVDLLRTVAWRLDYYCSLLMGNVVSA